MKKLFLFLLLLPLALHAQEVNHSPTVTVSGRVISNSGETLPGANIYLVNRQDTLQQFGVSSGNDGSFTLSIPPALYRMRVSYVGYRSQTAELEATKDVRLPDISLEENSQVLNAVTVTGRTVTYNAEGYVANVAANKQLQQLPLDRMLAFLPGMYVDREKIKVYMKEISTVYVNDREVHLTGQQLIDYLKAYDGKNIQKIEVIVNNGVEHAASSFGAASIRITTVKVIEGGMLSVGAGASYNKTNKRYGNPYGNLLWRHGKLSMEFSTSAYTYAKINTSGSQTTEYFDSGMTTLTETLSMTDSPRDTPVNLTLGYDFNENNLLSVNTYYRTMKHLNENTTSSRNVAKELIVEEFGQWRNKRNEEQASVVTEFVHRIDNGRLTAKASYGKSWKNQLYASEVVSDETPSHGLTDGDVQDETYKASLDFQRSYKDDKEKLKLGASFTSWTSHSNMLAEQYENDVLQEFGSYQDNYHYREHNYALYAGYDMNWERLNIQLGLRLEHLRVSPESRINPEGNRKSSYTNLFPNVTLNYAIDADRGHNMNVMYARVIDSPDMNELNPLIVWENEYSYRMGNPYLEPTFGHHLEMRMNLFNYYAVAVQYLDKKMRQTEYGTDDSGFLYTSPQNGGRSQQLSASLSANVMSIKNLMLNASATYSYYHSRYKDLSVNSSAWGFNLMADYQLPYDMNLSAICIYTIPEKGIYKTEQNWCMIDLDLSKNLSKNWQVWVRYSFLSHVDSDIRTATYRQTLLDGRSPHTISLSVKYTFKWGEWFKVRKRMKENVLDRIKDE